MSNCAAWWDALHLHKEGASTHDECPNLTAVQCVSVGLQALQHHQRKDGKLLQRQIVQMQAVVECLVRTLATLRHCSHALCQITYPQATLRCYAERPVLMEPVACRSRTLMLWTPGINAGVPSFQGPSPW